jgi:hypothetical protein
VRSSAVSLSRSAARLNGQAGNDILIGGKGMDTFAFDLVPSVGKNEGHDTIKDFEKALDLLSFEHVLDANKDGTVTLDDLLAKVSGVVDHGAGKNVDWWPIHPRSTSAPRLRRSRSRKLRGTACQGRAPLLFGVPPAGVEDPGLSRPL